MNELSYSYVAQTKNIDNTPPNWAKANLQILVEELLDPLREAWGSPILVRSGYRSEKLNRAVKGSKTSAHPIGFAVDIVPVNRKMEEFKRFVLNFLKDKAFDQCILESIGIPGTAEYIEWVHLGLFNRKGQQRRMTFEIKQ